MSFSGQLSIIIMYTVHGFNLSHNINANYARLTLYTNTDQHDNNVETTVETSRGLLTFESLAIMHDIYMKAIVYSIML